MNDSQLPIVAQAVLDLGREFREPADRTVRLMQDGVCWGRFVSPELLAQTQAALERATVPIPVVPMPRCLR